MGKFENKLIHAGASSGACDSHERQAEVCFRIDVFSWSESREWFTGFERLGMQNLLALIVFVGMCVGVSVAVNYFLRVPLIALVLAPTITTLLIFLTARPSPLLLLALIYSWIYSFFVCGFTTGIFFLFTYEIKDDNDRA